MDNHTDAVASNNFITSDRVDEVLGVEITQQNGDLEMQSQLNVYRNAISHLDRAAIKYDPSYLSYGGKTVWDSVVTSLAAGADVREENAELRESVRELRGALEGMLKYGVHNENWQDEHPEYLDSARAALTKTEHLAQEAV